MSGFSFTITDFGRLINRSPVTLRSWEKRGYLEFPRNGKGDRRLDIAGARRLALFLHDWGKLSTERLRLVEAILTLMELAETPCESGS